MNNSSKKRPIVLCFGGTDPSGGAGLSADIEAIASLGCRAAPVVTAVTVQDSVNVQRIHPLSGDDVREQAIAVLSDMPVAAIKIGLLGSADIALSIADLLDEHSDIPVILDPVLRAGGGAALADDLLIKTLQYELMPHALLVTPNLPEAIILAGDESLSGTEAAEKLLTLGAVNVLLTGGHSSGDDDNELSNILVRHSAEPVTLDWPRLPGEFHGSGCTLAAACAAGVAKGLPLRDAVAVAENYTFETLRNATTDGRGQQIPNRHYWADDSVRPL